MSLLFGLVMLIERWGKESVKTIAGATANVLVEDAIQNAA